MSGHAHPFIKWVGGKRALLPALLPMVPTEIETYIEPMIGGGALFWALAAERRFKRAIIADANPELARAYLAIQADPEAVLEKLRDHKHDEDHYYRVRDIDPATLSDAATAARLIFMNRVGFNGLYRLNRAGKCNVAFGSYAPMTEFTDPENIRACSRALAGVTIKVADFRDLQLDNAGLGPGDFVYFDPPYVPVSKTASFTKYTSGGFDLQDHSALAILATKLARAGVRVVVSNSDCPWAVRNYSTAAIPRLHDFEIIEASRSGAVNCATDKRGRVVELIIRSKVPDLGTTGQGESSVPNDATETPPELAVGGVQVEVVTRPGEQRPLFGGDLG